MSSREEFLRAMGISQSDMMNPDAVAPPTEMRSAPKKPQPSLRGEPMKSSSKSVAADGASGGARSMYDSESSYSKPSTRVPLGERQYGNTQEVSYAPGPKPVARANSNISATGSQEVPAETFFSGSRGGAGSNSFSGSMSGEPTATPKRSKADLQKEADQMKNEGNEAFQRQEFRKAIRCYSKAIECDPTNAALYSNRSAAYLAGAAQTGMDTRSMALRDAVKATELRPDWPKAYCRQAEALIEMERHREAQEAYEAAYRLDPSNDLYKENALKCQSKANPTGKASSAINPTLEENLPRASASCSSFTSMEERKCSARELQSKYLSEDGGDIFRGNEYRAQELERLRQRKSCGSLRDSGSTPTPGGSSTASTPTASMGSSGYFSAARNVPREYSSDAAKAYQQNLLEEYRRRKAQGKAA